MEYRTDVGEIASEVKRRSSLEAYEALVRSHAQLAALRAIAPGTDSPELASTTEAFHAAKRAFGRAAAAYTLVAEDVFGVSLSFLENWMRTLEQEHAAQVARIQSLTDAVEVVGANAMTDAERVKTQFEVQQALEAVRVLELSHGVCVQKLDALSSGSVDPTVEETD